jgi:hypothetical protein
LNLNQTEDKGDENAQIWLRSDVNEVCMRLDARLQLFHTETDDAVQITSLFRALLEMCGGRVELTQRRFNEKYTAGENCSLLASVFDMKKTNDFGDFDVDRMCKELSKSPTFLEKSIRVQDLKDWSAKMKDCLELGLEHLVRIRSN